MRTGQVPLFAVLVLLLFGVRTTLPKPPSPSSPPQSPSDTGHQHSAEGQRAAAGEVPPLWEALCKLNPGHQVTPDAMRRDILKSVASHREPGCFEDNRGNKFPLDADAVIAAVPDPVHIHLGLNFDRTIDAIQAAASGADPPYRHI